jgi:hypothetical protein
LTAAAACAIWSEEIAIANPGREVVATQVDASSVIWVNARKAIRTPLTVVIHGA